MRISDWSSDVCSSDLTRWIRLSGHHFVRAAVDLRLGHPTRLRIEGFCVPFLTRAGRVEGAQLIPVQDVPLPVEIVIDPFGTGLSFAQSLVEVTRSEEHTSELQSLMRISYAVFCLKKTKSLTIESQHYLTPQTSTTI